MLEEVIQSPSGLPSGLITEFSSSCRPLPRPHLPRPVTRTSSSPAHLSAVVPYLSCTLAAAVPTHLLSQQPLPVTPRDRIPSHCLIKIFQTV